MCNFKCVKILDFDVSRLVAIAQKQKNYSVAWLQR